MEMRKVFFPLHQGPEQVKEKRVRFQGFSNDDPWEVLIYSVHGLNVFALVALHHDPVAIHMVEDMINLVCSSRVSRPLSRVMPQ